MATIGLKIAQDPNSAESLSLADTLAKGIFGDPEGQMKARALASEVGVRMASRDKLLADTGLVQAKTKTEQDAEDARLRAGPLVGEAGAAAVPMPIPVEASRADAPGTTGYGPQQGIVSQHDLDVTNTLKARERALGPVLVLGDNPNATAEGINKNYGGTILSAAAANPANVSGDSLRIAGGLSTGSAPTTSTVWSEDDTSGVKAAAQQKILEARGSPQKPDVKEFSGTPYVINADGSLTAAQGFQPPAPDAPKTMTDAQGNTRQWDPLKGVWELAPGTPNAPPKLETVGKDTVQRNPDGSLSVPDVTGRPPAEPTTPFAESKGDEGIAFNTVLSIANKAASGKVISPDEARSYATTYNRLFGPRWDQKPDAQGVLRWVVTPGVPPPPGMVLPLPETFLGGQPPAPPVAQPPAPQPPVQTPPVVAAPPAAAPPVVAGGQVFANDQPKPIQVSAEQNKDRRFASSAAFANKPLDKFTPNQIPGVLASMLAIPKVSGNGFLANLGRANLPDEDKEWARNALEFTAAVNYEQSGAAVNADEWENAKQIYIPMPLDGPKQLAEKAAARRNWMQNAAKSGWSNDPKGLAEFLASLDQPAGGGGGGGSGPAPTDEVPPKSYTDQGGTPAGWKKVKNKGLWQ